MIDKLSYSQLRYSILEILLSGPAASVTSMAKSIHVLRESASRCVGEMEECGAIQRNDREIAITPAGRAVLESFEQRPANQLRLLLHEARCVMNALADSHYDEDLRATARDLDTKVTALLDG